MSRFPDPRAGQDGTEVLRLLRTVRQHHAIEHATLHVLGTQAQTRLAGGLSDAGGFTLFGDLDPDTVEQAARTAIACLREGRSRLALHPNCGTNLLTQALLSLTVGWLAFASGRGRSLHGVTAALLAFLAVGMISPGLGLRLQTYTTLADVRDRCVAEVYSLEVMGRPAIRVRIAASP